MRATVFSDQREHLPLRAELADVEARMTEVKGAIARVQKEADDLEREERARRGRGPADRGEDRVRGRQDVLGQGDQPQRGLGDPGRGRDAQAAQVAARGEGPRGARSSATSCSPSGSGSRRSSPTSSAKPARSARRSPTPKAEIDRELEARGHRSAHPSCRRSRPRRSISTSRSAESKRGVGVGALENGMLHRLPRGAVGGRGRPHQGEGPARRVAVPLRALPSSCS